MTQLRCKSDSVSSYTKATKRVDLRKRASSNGLYTLLAAVGSLLIQSIDQLLFEITIHLLLRTPKFFL